jgi:hypothetical protein
MVAVRVVGLDTLLWTTTHARCGHPDVPGSACGKTKRRWRCGCGCGCSVGVLHRRTATPGHADDADGDARPTPRTTAIRGHREQANLTATASADACDNCAAT